MIALFNYDSRLKLRKENVSKYHKAATKAKEMAQHYRKPFYMADVNGAYVVTSNEQALEGHYIMTFKPTQKEWKIVRSV